MNTYYRDADGDGYGNPKVSMTVRGAKPAGYVVDGSDCCDSDVNAHPGQTAFFAMADACGSSQVPDGFDYDCDGKDTPSAVATTCMSMSSTACGCDVCLCNPANVCGTSCSSLNANVACGMMYGHSEQYITGANPDGTCTYTGNGGLAGTLSCR
jgi:hypothetical protein